MTKGHILAIDEPPGSLRLLTEILSEEGYNVRSAANCELAIAAIAAAQPNLILLDIRMADAELCRRLKEGSTQNIPFLCISAVANTRDRIAALTLGAVDFISKPLQREELLARIRTHLELSRLRNRLEEIVAGTYVKSENCKRALADATSRAAPCRAGAPRK